MTLEHIKQVLEVEKTGSINQAANNLFLSQSALSLSIKSLESELGKRLFIQNTKGVVPTPFGKTVFSYMHTVQSQMDQIQALGRNSASRNSLSIKIADNGFQFVSNICAKLYNSYKTSGIRIELFDCTGDGTLDMVSNQLVELGVFRFWSCYRPFYLKQFSAKSIQFYPLTKKPLCIAIGKGNPLYYSDKASITPQELINFPMVMHEYMDSGPYSDILDKLNLGQSSNRIITSSRAVIYDFLARTDAYYLNSYLQDFYYSPTQNEYAEHTGIRSLILEDTNIVSEIGWVKHISYSPTPIANDFINLLNQFS